MMKPSKAEALKMMMIIIHRVPCIPSHVHHHHHLIFISPHQKASPEEAKVSTVNAFKTVN